MRLSMRCSLAEKLLLFVPVERCEFRRDIRFAGTIRVAHNLSDTAWHCPPEHLPLGNQSRARKRM